MAWGMFCWIPCPYKGWREEDRRAQIAMLPLVGACIGAIVCLIWWVLTLIGAGAVITGALLTGAYFLMTGFIHLDGFMDCSDATLPRHTDMATRVRILKDSHTGAFGVICLCLMLVLFAGAMIDVAPKFSLANCSILVLVFTTSRFVSASMVLLCRPMATSQYAKPAADDSQEKTGRISETIPSLIILIIILGAAEWITAGGTWWCLIAEPYSNITCLVVLVAAYITGRLDRRMLGGMNGDISGHMITTSEMFGVVAMALLI